MIPQYFLEDFLDGNRCNSQCFKSGQLRRSYSVALHQLNLILGDRRPREYFRGPSQYVPSSKWDWNQSRLQAGCARDNFNQFLVGIAARAAELECTACLFQGPYDRLRHIFHVGWLQFRQATAEHWIDWKLAKQPEEGGEKRVVRPEHYRWTDNCGVGKGGPYHQFAFASLADIERGRGRVRADPRKVYEPLHPIEACL